MTEEKNDKVDTVETQKLGEIAEYLSSKKFKIRDLGTNASGFEMLAVDANDLVAVAKDLQRSKKMSLLNFLTALEVKEGYQAIYQLEDTNTGNAVMLKVTVDKANPSIPSLCEIFPTANWFEREAFDMMGIKFEDHPNLVRILNPDNWEGYPLRRDYVGPCDELNQPIVLNK